jgi:hypothetical protein
MPNFLGTLKPLAAYSTPFSLWNMIKKEEKLKARQQGENEPYKQAFYITY